MQKITYEIYQVTLIDFDGNGIKAVPFKTKPRFISDHYKHYKKIYEFFKRRYTKLHHLEFGYTLNVKSNF